MVGSGLEKDQKVLDQSRRVSVDGVTEFNTDQAVGQQRVNQVGVVSWHKKRKMEDGR